MNNRSKIKISFIFFSTAILLVYFLWKNSIILSILLIFLSIAKHKIIPIKKELLIFVVAGLVGMVGESFIISNGAWLYSNPQIFNVPLYLFFLWGVAGITGISMYLGLIEN